MKNQLRQNDTDSILRCSYLRCTSIRIGCLILVLISLLMSSLTLRMLLSNINVTQIVKKCDKMPLGIHTDLGDCLKMP